MTKAYFKPIDSYKKTDLISQSARELLEKVVREEGIKLTGEVPLKVHFGEAGNETFIGAKNYKGIIDFLDKNRVESVFIETNALYRGRRTGAKEHKKLAQEHGFTRLPVIIADGEKGNDYEEIKISGKHFRKCKIGKAFERYRQMIVLSHFKGHMLAGFGGALKQLAMGFAARGGKLDQHSNSHPVLDAEKCERCGACVKQCPADAIRLEPVPRIDGEKCIGCAGCIAACNYEAMNVDFSNSSVKIFRERMAEYVLAAQKGKNNIYFNFCFNITELCDCRGIEMKPVARDFGILASVDPVAIDQASMDLVDKKEGRKVFGGRDAIRYAEKLKIGRREYELVEI
ncbi:MAG: DUF362 domain-containing protein [Patescibacteria group bacterium]|nr:DUF362 domain-containing protein [Patescibacteria group bacterium]